MKPFFTILIAAFLFCCTRSAVAQDTIYSGEQRFIYVDKMPQFPVGPSAMLEYISKNFRYPSELTATEYPGRVSVKFLVTKTGELKDITVLKKIHPLLKAEYIRVVRQMPRWEPAVLKNQKVDCSYTLPIIIELD